MVAVQSATLRAFCATTAGSPRIIRMNAAPASGRKITRDRSGQSLIAAPQTANRYQLTRAATPISMANA